MNMQRRRQQPSEAFLRAGNRGRAPAAAVDERSVHMQPLCLPGPGTFLIAEHLRLQLHGPAPR